MDVSNVEDLQSLLLADLLGEDEEDDFSEEEEEEPSHFAAAVAETGTASTTEHQPLLPPPPEEQEQANFTLISGSKEFDDAEEDNVDISLISGSEEVKSTGQPSGGHEGQRRHEQVLFAHELPDVTEPDPELDFPAVLTRKVVQRSASTSQWTLADLRGGVQPRDSVALALADAKKRSLENTSKQLGIQKKPSPRKKPAKPKQKGPGRKRKKRPDDSDDFEDVSDPEERERLRALASIEESMRDEGKRMSSKKRKKRKKVPKLNPELASKVGEANEAFMMQEYKRASELLLEVIKKAPRASAPYHTLGLVYEEMGEAVPAMQAYVIAAHLTPKDVDLWGRVAEMAQQHNRPKLALYCYNKAVRLDPDNMRHRWERALVQIELEDYSRAAEGFYFLLQRDPQNPELLKNLVDSYAGMKRYLSAMLLLQRYMQYIKVATDTQHPRFDPTARVDLNLVNVLGELYMRSAKYKDTLRICAEAEVYLERAAARTGEEVEDLPIDLVVKRGICQMHLELTDKANEIFEYLFAEDVEAYGDLYLEVGEAFFVRGMYERVSSVLDAVSGVEQWQTPQLWELQAKFKVATCNGEESVLQEALQLYLTCLDSDPENQVVRVACSEIYHSLGDRETALAIIGHDDDPHAGEEGDEIDYRAKHEHFRALWNVPLDTDNIIRGFPDLDRLYDNSKLYMQMENFERFGREIFPKVRSTIMAYMGVFSDLDEPDAKNSRRTHSATSSSGVVTSFGPSSTAPASASSSSVALSGGLEDVSALLEEDGDGASEQESKRKLEFAFLKMGTSWKGRSRRVFRSDKFVEILTDTTRVLCHCGVDQEVVELIKAVESKAEKNTPFARCCRYSLGMAYRNLGEWYKAYANVRPLFYRDRMDKELLRLLLEVLNGVEYANKVGKFVERMVDQDENKHPGGRTAIRMLSGNHMLLNQRYQLAYQRYKETQELVPRDDPTLHFLMGISLLLHSMEARGKDPDHDVVRAAFGMLLRYLELATNAGETVYAYYNMGRAYQHIGVAHLAHKYYREVLRQYDDAAAASDAAKKRKSRRIHGLARCAAHNLAVMYMQSGSPELSRELYEKYCTF